MKDLLLKEWNDDAVIIPSHKMSSFKATEINLK